MLDLESGELAFSERAYADYLRGIVHDYGESTDHGQTAQEMANAELAQAFECPLHTHADSLDRLRQIDFGPRSEVEEGAVVRLGGQWFVIAVATKEFVCSGVTYMGISREAPIFKALEGKRVNDNILFNGRRLIIEAVV
jgi:hypothetical protein